MLAAAVTLYVGLALAVPLTAPAFFYWDEWSWLVSLSHNSPLVWGLQKHLGHFYPVGKLAFFVEVTLFKDGYRAYLLVNVAVHALNTFLLFRLTRRLTRTELAPLLVSSLYLFTPMQNENVFWAMQIAVLLGATCLLITFDRVASLAEHGERRHLLAIVAASCAAPFFFDLLLPAPFLALVLYSGLTGGLLAGDRRCRRNAIVLGATQLALIAIYLLAGQLSSDHGNHAGAIDAVPLSQTVARIRLKNVEYVLFGIGSLLFHFLGLLSDRPPYPGLVWVGLLLVVHGLAIWGGRSSWAASFRIYAAMLVPLLFFLSLKRGYALHTSLTGRYLTLLYIPCALFWARWLASQLEARSSTLSTSRLVEFRARAAPWLLSLLTVALIGVHLLEHAWFFEGSKRRFALSNAISRREAVRPSLARFYALTDDAAASGRLLAPSTSPELTEAEALRIRRVLFRR